LKKRLGVVGVATLLVAVLFTLAAFGSDAQMYFSSDKNGQNRVTNVQEGDEVFIVVIDNDENIDCDVRDKIWTEIKVLDPKTGAYIVWISYLDENGDANGVEYHEEGYTPYKGHYPGKPGWLTADYLEETGADTGVFVSKRSFQVGTRENYDNDITNTHVVDSSLGYLGIAGLPFEFQWGHYEYIQAVPNRFTMAPVPSVNLMADDRGWFGPRRTVATKWPFTTGAMARTVLPAYLPSELQQETGGYLLGRFENMNTLMGMYQDQNDATDIAVGQMKIIDVEGTISWDQEVYKDANASATITVVDADENVNCNEIEYVPVFILVNPGSWNPVQTSSPTKFATLLETGGVIPDDSPTASILDRPIRWYNIYDSGLVRTTHFTWTDPDTDSSIENNQEKVDGTYFVQYPVAAHNNVTAFDTTDENGFARVMFYAQETGVDTGVFQLNINSILWDLGFDQLAVRDVLVAYYLDPNDFDDFKLSTAYIEERQHSVTSFTDANRADKEIYWIGRDPVYVQVIDANANVDPCCPEQVVVQIFDPHGEDDQEWIILDETSSNSPVFFTFAGYQLWPVWDALGVGLSDSNGGYQLQLDNWKIEVFNEDDVMAHYNDVYYTQAAMAGLGDVNIQTAYPPQIQRVRVANDVSFDMMSIGDTQVFDGTETQMYFLDRQGNRVSGYVNSDCVFVEVIDPDQDEDQYRRERVDAYWDANQNYPFGPYDFEENHALCGYLDCITHPVNALLGDTNIFSGYGENSECDDSNETVREKSTLAKLYVLNPRNGYWAAIDLLETGVATGDFVSVTCIDLVQVYECTPSLGVLPGDTVVAFYQDPSNHSDSAMISLKVGIGGGGTPPTQQSTTMFVDADGNDVANYTDADLAYVKVIDPSHTGASLLANAVEIDGMTYDLTLVADDVFMTAGLDLGLEAGSSVTATYTDPTDPTDSSSDTITVIASVLEVVEFYAGPSPFEGDCSFGYAGTGTASVMTVEIYNLAGALVWASELTDVTEIVWDGTDMTGSALANGAYLYKVTATDGTNSFAGNGKVFINR